MLAGEGIDVHIVHIPTIKPLDISAVVEAAEKTGLVLSTEEHTIVGGMGGAVAEALATHSPTPMVLHGLQDTFGESGPDGPLLDKYGISPEKTAAAIRGALENR